MSASVLASGYRAPSEAEVPVGLRKVNVDKKIRHFLLPVVALHRLQWLYVRKLILHVRKGEILLSEADSDDMHVRQLACMTCVREKWTLPLHRAFSVSAFAANSFTDISYTASY